MKTINILFIHPNFPGQFKVLLSHLAKISNVRVAFITRNQNAAMEGVEIQHYQLPDKQAAVGQDQTFIHETYKYLRGANANLFETHEVTKAALSLQHQKSFEPHVVIGHIGWAGTLFMKDVFPNTKIIGYCEWFYRIETSWEYFSNQELSLEQKTTIRMRNASATLCLETMDVGVSPMIWQRSVHPQDYQQHIEVIHEGIDTENCQPRPRTHLRVPGANLDASQTIITYVSRALEPARGFFSFMAAVEKICQHDEMVHFVVVGRERAAYSDGTGDGPSYKQQALEKFKCDWSRIHFTGKLSYTDYLSVLQNSRIHVHLSAPIFLSWSLLEAMSCACTIVSSNNAPVNEVIKHNETGRLVPFFDEQKLADEVLDLLDDQTESDRLGSAARSLVVKKYNQKHCVNEWKQLILRTLQE